MKISETYFMLQDTTAMLQYFATLGLWLRLECSFDSLSIDPAHVIYLAEGHNVGSERQSSVMTLRKPIVTWII